MADLYVDTDSGNNGNAGTSWGAAKATLSGAEALISGTLSEPYTIHCKGSAADTTRVTFFGATTSATNYIKVVVDAADRHNGRYCDGNNSTTAKYRLELDPGSGEGVIGIINNHMWFDGLQIYQNANTSGSRYAVLVSGVGATNHVRFSNCIIRNSASASYTEQGIRIDDADAIVDMWNCMIYGSGTSGASYGVNVANATTVNLWNCTVQGGVYGVSRTAGTVTAKNCYSSGAVAYNGTITMTSCAASDTTASGTDPHDSIAYNTTQFVNVTAGQENLHLPGTGSGLYGLGADNTGDGSPLNFTTDIDGDTIAGRYDIGADWYYTAVAGLSIPVAMHHYRHNV